MRTVLTLLAAVTLCGCANPTIASASRLLDDVKVVSESAAEQLYTGYERLPNGYCNLTVTEPISFDEGTKISYKINISCQTGLLSTDISYEPSCTYLLGEQYRFVDGTNRLSISSNSVELNASTVGELIDGRNVEGNVTMCPPSE